MPKLCYVPKNFRHESFVLIGRANSIIEDYAAQGLSLTLRQLYYRFVAQDWIPNTQKSYTRLGSLINDARLAGYIDWDAIEDRGRNLIKSPHWLSPEDILDTCAQQFTVDKWKGQENRVEVWVEKQALEAVVGRAAEKWDCPYFACKGYTSQSEMWRAAERFKSRPQNPVIIHLGDHDPSGIDMTRDIVDRLNDVFRVQVRVVRIALNMDQVEEHRPPPNPAKMTDSRFAAYAQEFGTKSWELDALEPATLNDLIETEIQKHLDLDLYSLREAEEQEGRDLLESVSDQWTDVVEGL